MASLSLKQLARRGAAWTILGYGASQIIRFSSNLVLTRLLVPEYFGLLGLVTTLRVGLELLSDIGIGQSIIQNQEGDQEDFINTAWSLGIIRGVVLWGLSLLLTAPMAHFYGDDRFLTLVPIIGLTLILTGLHSTNLFTLNRQMDLRSITLFELGLQIVSTIVVLIAVWRYPTVWCLAISSLAYPALRMIGSYLILPNSLNRWCLDPAAVKQIFGFGKWLFISTALMFLAEQADRLLLGKLFDFQTVGVYTIAYTLADVPRNVLKYLGDQVIFPTVSKQAELSRSELSRKIQKQRQPLLFGLIGLLTVMVVWGDRIIDLLYDDRYQAAMWMLPMLSIGIWFSALFYVMRPVLLGIGQPKYLAYSNLAKLLTIVIGLPFSLQLGGLPVTVLVIACSDLLPYGVIQYGLYREKLGCLRQDFQVTLMLVGAIAMGGYLRYQLGLGWSLSELWQ
jgi:O-antigen/teichoic acid export membrane protein